MQQPDPSLFQPIRNSRLELGQVYFRTSTIKDWKRLLKPDKYKQLVPDTWRRLAERQLMAVYGFVIMPNHLHVICEMLRNNGKEMPHASFNKTTSHLLVQDLKQQHPAVLAHFRVDEPERPYRIWQRDALAILLDSRAKAAQKLAYLHLNPLHERWQLVDRPENYLWSSARFYETGVDAFGFLTDYQVRL